jgi:hypothetical protein
LQVVNLKNEKVIFEKDLYSFILDELTDDLLFMLYQRIGNGILYSSNQP